MFSSSSPLLLQFYEGEGEGDGKLKRLWNETSTTEKAEQVKGDFLGEERIGVMFYFYSLFSVPVSSS